MDNKKIVTFGEKMVKMASKKGVKKEYIKIAKKYYSEQNRFVKAAIEGKNLEEVRISKEVTDEFDTYFNDIRKGNKSINNNSTFAARNRQICLDIVG